MRPQTVGASRPIASDACFLYAFYGLCILFALLLFLTMKVVCPSPIMLCGQCFRSHCRALLGYVRECGWDLWPL